MFTTSLTNLFSRLNEWNEMKEKLKDGNIDEIQYDNWRYNYPTRFVEIKPSQELSDMLVAEYNKNHKKKK